MMLVQLISFEMGKTMSVVVPWWEVFGFQYTVVSCDPTTVFTTAASPSGAISGFTSRVKVITSEPLFFNASNWAAVRGNLAKTLLEMPNVPLAAIIWV